MQRSGGRCYYCGRHVRMRGGEYSLDHVVARAQGGGSSRDNLRAACRECNSDKGVESLEAYRAQVAARHGLTEEQVRFWGEGGRWGPYLRRNE